MPQQRKDFAKRTATADLLPWQIQYLNGGYELFTLKSPKKMGPLLAHFHLWRLIDGDRKPAFMDPVHGLGPGELWQRFGGHYLGAFIDSRPGERPVPWWTFESGLEREAALKLARASPEKQRGWLEKHNLLTEKERKQK